MVHKRENARKILFDFLKNRKYNYNERVAGERKSSFPAARFFFSREDSHSVSPAYMTRCALFLCQKERS